MGMYQYRGNATRKIYVPFVGDGLRYELAEFVKAINATSTMRIWSAEDSLAVLRLIVEGRRRSKGGQ